MLFVKKNGNLLKVVVVLQGTSEMVFASMAMQFHVVHKKVFGGFGVSLFHEKITKVFNYFISTIWCQLSSWRVSWSIQNNSRLALTRTSGLQTSFQRIINVNITLKPLDWEFIQWFYSLKRSAKINEIKENKNIGWRRWENHTTILLSNISTKDKGTKAL